jgi:hypothetical protein
MGSGVLASNTVADSYARRVRVFVLRPLIIGLHTFQETFNQPGFRSGLNLPSFTAPVGSSPGSCS